MSDKKITDVYNLDKKKLGEGSYGSVCKAKKKEKQGSNDQEYAVKTIPKDPKNKKNETRTLQEIRIMKDMSHPNVIKLYESFEDHRSMYLVMELCIGGELFDRIIEAGHFSEAQAGLIMKQIFEALNYMHVVKKIAHRDLKPENFLMLNKDKIDAKGNHLKIIDFGLSCPFEPGQVLKTKAGTPYYVAPEVLAGAYDEKSDLWSCGVIMFVLHCGYPPFFGESDAEVLKKVKQGKFEFNNSDWKKVSGAAKDVITKLLTKDPKTRYSAKQALDHEWSVKVAAAQQGDLGKDIVGQLRGTVAHSKLKKLALKAIAGTMGSQQIKDLQTAFKDLDADGDGLLTAAELKKGLAKAGVPDKEIDEIYASMDVDGGGTVDYEEFLTSTIEKRVKLEDDVLWDAFKQFDKNNDGQISKSELKEVGENLDNSFWDKGALDDLIKQADKDGDGMISFDEFKQAITKQ
jgi:calcium-dependent protein kinase